MKNSELGAIIEKLGRNIAHYECQSIRAYRDRDFESSRKFHEKALAMEQRVAKYLSDLPHGTPRNSLNDCVFRGCLSS